MPRCCVPNCKSGTFSEVKQTRLAGLRPRSFFSFPKNRDLLDKWKEIIFFKTDKIVTHLKICELHFQEQDIIKFDETILKDGTVYRIPRERYTLQNHAIPMASNMETKKKLELNQEEKQDRILNTINVMPVKQQYGISRRKINAQIGTNAIINKSCDKLLKSSKEMINKNSEIEKNDCNFDININNDQNENEMKVQANENLNENDVLRKQNEDKIEQNKQDYSFSQLRTDLQAKNLNISSCWAHAFQENNSITLAYVHPLKLAIQLFCEVDSAMNVKIMASNKKINKSVNIKLNSSIDFVNYLCKLEKTKCCDGTGINNMYSDTCQGFISSEEEYKRSRGYHRCNSCREYRRILLKREDNIINYELRLRAQSRRIKVLQFKYSLLKKFLEKKTAADCTSNIFSQKDDIQLTNSI